MCMHEEKYCPRCKRLFECKAGSILQCQCSQLKLTENERNYIEQHYADCLCIRCLEEIKLLLVQSSG